MDDDDILGKKKSTIFPIYLSKKDYFQTPEKKTLSDALIPTKKVRRALPRQCQCGNCGGQWFIPSIDNKFGDPEQNIKFGHYGQSIKELSEISKQKRLLKEQNCPFTIENLKIASKESGITYRNLANLIGVSFNYAKVDMIQYGLIPPLKIQVKIVKLFPNMKLKDGFDRDEFLLKHDIDDDKKSEE